MDRFKSKQALGKLSASPSPAAPLSTGRRAVNGTHLLLPARGRRSSRPRRTRTRRDSSMRTETVDFVANLNKYGRSRGKRGGSGAARGAAGHRDIG